MTLLHPVIPSCPLCGQNQLVPYQNCVDHLVSGENFPLAECPGCGLILTQNQPLDPSPYYTSPEYISHHSNESSPFARIYRLARNYNIGWKLRLVRSFASDGYLLDYGCGTGEFLRAAGRSGFKPIGVEPAEVARRQATLGSDNPVYSHLGELPSATKFSVISLWHVLEHIPDFVGVLKSLRILLTANGVIVLALPNPSAPEVSHYQSLWAGYDVPRHLWHFRPATVEHLLRQCGFTLQKSVPMKLDAYYVSLLSEQYRRGSRTSSAWISALWRGWQSNRIAGRTGQYSSLVYIASA